MAAGYRREEVPVTTDLQLLRERCVLQQEHGYHDVEDDHHHESIPCSSGSDDRMLVQNSGVRSMATQAKYEIEPLRHGRSRLCRRLKHYRVGLLCSSIFTKTAAY